MGRCTLIELSYDVSIYEDNGVGYYLRDREVEPSEVLLLTDAVYSFQFISKADRAACPKLQKQLSVHQRKKYCHLTVARQGHKTGNRQVFWNIEQLDEAITSKKKVTLDYLHYGYDKRQHPRRPTLSAPMRWCTNEHYYLICVPDHDPHTRLYRIDRMADIRILGEPRSETPAQRQEAQDAVYAFVGAPERVVLHCDRAVLDDD